MPVVLGVDSSTQSCTVEVRDAESGALLGVASAPHPPTHPPASEQDPRAWWVALQAALALALGRARDVARVQPRDVVAMSVAAQCHGLVLLDDAGKPLRTARLWNDTTSAPFAAAIVERYGLEAWMSRVGMAPSAALTVAKAALTAHEDPALLRRAAHILVPHDYLTFRLTGRAVTDRSDAAGTGYFDVHRGAWLPEVLRDVVAADVDWPALLPEVLGPAEPAGPVRPDVAAALGLPAEVVVGPGGGDQHLGAVGLGLADGDLGVSLGTSGVVFSPRRDSVLDPLGVVDSVCDTTGGYLPLTCTLNAAKVTDTFARILGVDAAGLEALALAAPVDAERPVLVAYLDGERTPPRPGATGVLGALTTATTREGVALAAYEGVVAGLLVGVEALARVGVRADGALVVAGGGGRSLAYRQVLADLTGRGVELRDAPEATARGACVQAAAVWRGDDVGAVAARWRPGVVTRTEPRARYRVPGEVYDRLAAATGPGPAPDPTGA